MSDPTPETITGFWRGLEGLAGSPEGREELARSLAREFPPGAAEPPSGTTRRTVLGLMGASLALAGLTSCRRPEEAIVPYVDPPEDRIPGIPERYATTMPLGTSAYGVLVTSREGRPTKIEGNELHPASGGAASAWMQASILGLYDPDRSRRVLRRQDGNLVPSTWEAFIEAWSDTAYDLVDRQGAGTAVLIEPYASPTLARLAGRLRRRFDRLRWVVWSPAGDESAFEGLRLATGRAGRPLYHLGEARVILALDADLLLTESEAVAHSRGFARGRRPDGEMNRLYAVESTLTLTGANADHRLRLQSRQIPAFAAALAVRLRGLGAALERPAGAAAPELPEAVTTKLDTIARDLLAAGPRALVAAGCGQPPEVHALAHAVNRALGAVGTTVTVGSLADTGWGTTADLAGLTAAMHAGEIDNLYILGGNPAYTAPADLGFAEALGKVAHTAHLSSHLDETSRLCEWHLPRSHYLESWGDARAADGTPSVIQPLIAPLFDTRSTLEVLGLLGRDQEVDSLGQVRITWQDLLGGGDFENRFRRVLHDGVGSPDLLGPASLEEEDPEGAGLIEEIFDPARALARAFSAAATGAPPGLEVTFRLSPSVHDGRFANVSWLQELPDPLTKITWDNAALVSPGTAEELGLQDGDVVRLSLGERSLEVPVWRLPGQADGSVALALGYGRDGAGRVGDGVGFDAYRLRGSVSPWGEGGVTLEKLGRRHDLSQTQEHWEMEGRHLVREATLAEYREHPGFVHQGAEHEAVDLWPAPADYTGGHRWGMAVDLSACTGCNACVVACQSENNIPVVGKEQVARSREMHWLRVDRYFEGAGSAPRVVFQPVACQHCENAPCEQVCPVAATVHDAEGLNLMVYNRCIGTRYCSNNCPYKVRRFNFFNYTKDTPELLALAMNPDVTVRSRGVMEKCTYCLQRIKAAKAQARRADRPLADGDIETACQQTCPADAIVFGDLNLPGSRVAELQAGERAYELLAELHDKPRTSYLGKVRNPNPEWGEA